MKFSSITVLLCVSGFNTNKDGIRYPELRCLLCGEVIKAMKPKNIKVMVVFLHEYHKNTFTSILLDVVEMKSNSDTKAVMNKIIKDFELTDTDPIITADCANCNTSAFKDKHHGCWSHRFNTAFAHMVKTNVKSENTKVYHGLSDKNRKLVDDYFSSVSSILKRVKGKIYTEFKSFYERQVNNIIPSNSLNLRQPPTESPTRWLGIIPLLKWLCCFSLLKLTTMESIT